MSNKRDSFPPNVITDVLRQSGYICSNPQCRRFLIGPADIYMGGCIYLGEVAHIEAASPKGPRYNSGSTPEYRSSIDNAIVLCLNCHRGVVDKNETIYTVEILKNWKQQHLEFVKKNFADEQFTDMVNLFDSNKDNYEKYKFSISNKVIKLYTLLTEKLTVHFINDILASDGIENGFILHVYEDVLDYEIIHPLDNYDFYINEEYQELINSIKGNLIELNALFNGVREAHTSINDRNVVNLHQNNKKTARNLIVKIFECRDELIKKLAIDFQL